MSKSFPLSFKALFKVESITVLHPLVLLFPNSSSCQAFSEFITDTILDRVANGSLSVWERVGEVPPSHLVMPITVEPSKPSVCQHDERFFNLWIKYLPFSLDLITDLPRNVHKGSFQITCDDKSGYDHIRLSPDSRTWFGLQWNAWYFVFNTLPFGWKANTYLYHSIGVVATSFIRSHGVPCSQYIDDRHFGELQITVTLLRVCGLTFSALRQPFVSPVTSSSIFVTSLALKSHLSFLHKRQFFFWGMS